MRAAHQPVEACLSAREPPTVCTADRFAALAGRVVRTHVIPAAIAFSLAARFNPADHPLPAGLTSLYVRIPAGQDHRLSARPINSGPRRPAYDERFNRLTRASPRRTGSCFRDFTISHSVIVVPFGYVLCPWVYRQRSPHARGITITMINIGPMVRRCGGLLYFLLYWGYFLEAS